MKQKIIHQIGMEVFEQKPKSVYFVVVIKIKKIENLLVRWLRIFIFNFICLFSSLNKTTFKHECQEINL